MSLYTSLEGTVRERHSESVYQLRGDRDRERETVQVAYSELAGSPFVSVKVTV